MSKRFHDPPRRGRWTAVGLLFILGPTALEAQSIRGRVIDAESAAPVPAAEVTAQAGDEVLGRALADAEGRFSLTLDRPDAVLLSATSIGYRPSDPTELRVNSSNELIDVVIRLSSQAIELEGLTVVARGLELRHRASFEGFEWRHERSRRVGNVRVVRADDIVMRSVMGVGDLLKTWPDPLGCTVLYIDGRIATGWGDLKLVSTVGVEGVEYYRDVHDAPLEFRDGGPPCLRSPRWSVVVIWRERL